MRDINRIDKVLNVLAEYWYSHPDLRLGQILGNMDINYYVEDEDALMILQNNIEHDHRIDALKRRFNFDYVLESADRGDFSEFVVKCGGDTLTWRVYGRNGDYKIYER